jgi:TAT (twin-arginine translocation) pathway signal sequence
MAARARDELSRRTFLSTGLAATGAALTGARAQVEGNNVNSDAWVLEHVQPSMFAEPSGDACDF